MSWRPRLVVANRFRFKMIGPHVAPSDSAIVTGEIQAESFGAHRGIVEVESDDRMIQLEAETWASP